MDEQKIDAAPVKAARFVEQPEQGPRFLSAGGAELRIDGAHPLTSARQSEALPQRAVTSPSRSGSQALLDAAMFLQDMQERSAKLDDREAQFLQRLTEFEEDLRRFELRRNQQVEEIEKARLQLNADEATLLDRMKAAENLLRQVDADRLTIERERVDLERRRATIREDVLDELQLERQAIEADRLELVSELERAQELTRSLEEQNRIATAEAEHLIQSERERLWQSLIAEWEEKRRQFQSEHDQWLVASNAERLEIEREKAFYEAAIRNAEADFAAARETQAAELQLIREQHANALKVEREQHLAALLTERAEWEQQRSSQQAELLALREKQSASLQAEKDDWHRTYSIQHSELNSERSVLESRIRFQQEHLEKLRSELDHAQNEHRHERQLERQRLEESAQLLLRRMRQIDLYRAAVDEREKSLEREREILAKSRRAFNSTTDLDRLSLQAEKQAWEQERQIQQAELRRQQDLLTSHSENLESRRIRLDKLRAELEDTHRSTLEMRLAVEETWVELTQSAGQDEARQRVEQVRHALVGYYRQLHDGLVDQRREHLESQTKFERLRAEFLDERQKLTEWIAARDEELRIGEERLRIASAESSARDASWQAARDRWLHEKAEAEQVIRKLLVELGNQHRDPSGTAASLSTELPSLQVSDHLVLGTGNDVATNDSAASFHAVTQIILNEDR